MWLGMVALLSQRLTGGNHPCCHGNVNTRLCRHLHCCYCASVDNACTGVVNACTGVDNACTGVVNTCTYACVVRKIWYDYLYYTRALFRLCEQFKHVKRLDLLLNTLSLSLSHSHSHSRCLFPLRMQWDVGQVDVLAQCRTGGSGHPPMSQILLLLHQPTPHR